MNLKVSQLEAENLKNSSQLGILSLQFKTDIESILLTSLFFPSVVTFCLSEVYLLGSCVGGIFGIVINTFVCVQQKFKM